MTGAGLLHRRAGSALAIGLGALVVTGAACGGTDDMDEPPPETSEQQRSEARPRDLATARAALERNRERIRAIDGAVGNATGVTEAAERAGRQVGPDEEVYVIVVYLRSARFEAGAPTSMDGVPVRYIVTGIPRAQ